MYILVYMETLIKTKIKKWGNSQGLRLNRELLDYFGVGVDDEVSITKNKQSIIIKPVQDKNKKILKKLLSKIPKDYKPKEIDWGRPVGREIW